MNFQWSQHEVNPQRAKRRSRVQSACLRCRRQKLRCDQERPCSLCLRSDVECVSEPTESERNRKKPFRQSDQAEEQGYNNGQRDAESLTSVKTNDDSPANGTTKGGSGKGSQRSPSARSPAAPSSKSTAAIGRSESFDERTSSVGLTKQVRIAIVAFLVQETSSVLTLDQIIEDFSPETIIGGSTSALPGGSELTYNARGTQQDQVQLDQLLGMNLPSKKITDYLLDKYMDGVHWFMTIFHEPTLRLNYEVLLTSRRCPRSSLNRARVILLLLGLGAVYAREDDVQRKFPLFDLLEFRKQSLNNVGQALNDLYDAAGIETVQICILIGSFYLYTGTPNRSFVLLGAAVKCAQLMNLQRESTWRGFSEVAKEERRRTFWALFIYDRFASTIFGKPCSLSMEDIDVKIPEAMGDNEVQHPCFRTTATMPNGSIEPVTTFSYVKYKTKLYQISSPIIGDLYFHRSSNVKELAAKVSRIHAELVEFHESLPPELRLEDLCRNPEEPVTPETRPFILQALALQLAYDNVQILLHRPLLSQDLREFDTKKTPRSERGLSVDGGHTSHSRSSGGVHKVLISSRDHCWESAIRSSELGKYSQCLRTARESHAAAFLGINLFTAGMVLCVVALSRPLSSQAQLAKQAVARIISISRFLSGRVLLSAQTTKVLKDLVRLIGDKEVNVILAGPEDFDGLEGGGTTSDKPLTGKQSSEDLPLADAQKDAVEELMGLQNELRVQQEQPFNDPALDVATFNKLEFFGLGNMDITNGINTLQQAMFPASAVGTPDRVQTSGYIAADSAWNPNQYNASNTFVESTSGSESGLLGTDFDMMNTVGQTWLWDSVSWNP